jgi:hypothetical protein
MEEGLWRSPPLSPHAAYEQCLSLITVPQASKNETRGR